VLVLGWI